MRALSKILTVILALCCVFLAMGGGGSQLQALGTPPASMPLRATSARAPPAGVPDDGVLLYTAAGHRHLAGEHFSLPATGLAPLTAEAQALLYAHQHPPSCAGAKFIVSKGNVPLAGLGSHLHIATAHVSMALELGRVFLWHEEAGSVYTDEATCAPSPLNFECFFLAPSSCTLADARASGADTIEVRFGDAGLKHGMEFYHVPASMQALWENARLPIVRSSTGQQDYVKLWFRAQAAAYLSRFNPSTVEALRALRLTAPQGAIVAVAGPGAAADTAALFASSFPLPRGTISIHIRHGDKGTEMALVPTARYVEAAAKLAKGNPLALARYSLFLSTEDPGAVEEASALATARGSSWVLGSWNVGRINSNGPDQLDKLGVPRGALTRVWLLQLLLALECDAWVGTRASNWNRLIDELRCIWVPKCQLEFEEVGDVARWEHIAWR